MGQTYPDFNDILVVLFHDIWYIEETTVFTGEFGDITSKDIRIIEAVGPGEAKNMTAIAKKVAVTAGTLSTTMSALVKKGYVSRERSPQDRRMVLIRLTEKGNRAYRLHAAFFHEMIDNIVKNLDDEGKSVLIKTMIRLKRFLLERGKGAEGRTAEMKSGGV